MRRHGAARYRSTGSRGFRSRGRCTAGRGSARTSGYAGLGNTTCRSRGGIALSRHRRRSRFATGCHGFGGDCRRRNAGPGGCASVGGRNTLGSRLWSFSAGTRWHRRSRCRCWRCGLGSRDDSRRRCFRCSRRRGRGCRTARGERLLAGLRLFCRLRSLRSLRRRRLRRRRRSRGRGHGESNRRRRKERGKGLHRIGFRSRWLYNWGRSWQRCSHRCNSNGSRNRWGKRRRCRHGGRQRCRRERCSSECCRILRWSGIGLRRRHGGVRRSSRCRRVLRRCGV